MYDDSNTTNTGMDQVAQEIEAQTQNLGLGVNPSGPNPPVLPQASSAPTPPAASPNPASTLPPEDTTPQEQTQPEAPATEAAPAASGELLDIKQHALTELMPLVDKLEQTPEERYKTLMMLIQASDDQSLVKAAYDAAHQIEDEKTKAEALLGIVNEINYFTTQKSANADQ